MDTKRKNTISKIPNLVSTAADIIAGLSGALPKSVKKEHGFPNYEDYLANNNASAEQLKLQRSTPLNPSLLISVGLVCAGKEKVEPDATLFSMLAQTYTNWEVCAAFDLDETRLERFDGIENFRLILSDGDEKSLAKLVNKQLRGAYILQLIPGDKLASDALYSMVQAIKANPKVELVFCDEDEVTPDGCRQNPIFKPDYGGKTLLSYNSIGRPMLVSKRVFEKVGGFIGNSSNDLWEYALKCAKEADSIAHIARVMLSSQKKKNENDFAKNGSISKSDSQKTEETRPVSVEMKQKINKLLEKEKPIGRCCEGNVAGFLRSSYIPKKNPKVSVIIPNYADKEALKRCLESIEIKTTYDGYTVFVADDKREDAGLRTYLTALKKCKAAQLIEVKEGDPMPSILNQCVQHAISEVMLFLNGDGEILTPNYIEELVGLAINRKSGAVGGKILDSNDNILSVGTVIGLGGWADSPYVNTPDDSADWLKCSFTEAQRNVSAVSSAFMAIRGEIFMDFGGFDETLSGVGFDTELCIRLMRRGYTNIFTPHAKIKLYGSLPSYEVAGSANLTRCYDSYRQTLLTGDKFYNSNFDYAFTEPTLAITPYEAIKLNPLYK